MRETVGHDRKKRRAIHTFMKSDKCVCNVATGECTHRFPICTVYALLFVSIEPTMPRSLPSFLVMLIMRPTWRRAYSNFRHFSPLHRKWTLGELHWSILTAQKNSVYRQRICIYGIASIEVEVSFFALCTLRFITSYCIRAFMKFLLREINIEETLIRFFDISKELHICDRLYIYLDCRFLFRKFRQNIYSDLISIS